LLYSEDMNKAPRFEDIQRVEVSRAVADFLAWRLIALPVGLVLVAVVFAFDTNVLRRALIGTLFVAVTIIFVAQYLKYRRGGDAAAVISMNGVLLTVAQLKLVVATGGVESPLFPAMVIAAFLVAMFLTPRWAKICIWLQIASTMALTVLQASGRVQLLPEFLGASATASPASLLWVRGGFGCAFLFSVMRVGARVRRAFDAVGESAVRARDESLESYAHETRAITTMAGEIAHELKNPLATVKGLAQLVAKDAEGKSAERIGVLRREVDRMQGILEEFLNFSRPLVPLTQREVRLDELCADVVLLHESVAAERKVSVVPPSATGLTARCDPRKVKQILINLLQNALAASPAGAEIRFAVEAAANDGESMVRVTVADQGPGLPAEIAAHVFEAGVTNKPGGSGLGLTVSRALARQHGGELALKSSSHGCVGELVLPRRGAQIEREGEAA
jgi:signal transduction histidine kinase